MIETRDYQALLAQNREMLARHAQRHDLNGAHGIEIGSRYKDRETARAARKYIEEKYGIPQSVLFRVSICRYSEDDITIDLAFALESVPDAALITKYEFMLQDAAKKFGGETPGWEIALS